MMLLADDRALRMAQLINEARSEEGLEPLMVEVHLNEAARVQSEYMNEINDISHEGPHGSSIADRAREAGFDFSGNWRVTENVGFLQGFGAFDDEALVFMHEAFMESHDHYQNIMELNVNFIGINVHEGSTAASDSIEIPTLFVTVKFARTQGKAIVQDPETNDLMIYFSGEFSEFEDSFESTQEMSDEDAETEEGSSFFMSFNKYEKYKTRPEQGRKQNDDEQEVVCFIATSAFGSRRHPDVMALRRYRDFVLTRSKVGNSVISLYNKFGPLFARFVRPERFGARVLRVVLHLISRLVDPGLRVKLGAASEERPRP